MSIALLAKLTTVFAFSPSSLSSASTPQHHRLRQSSRSLSWESRSSIFSSPLPSLSLSSPLHRRAPELIPSLPLPPFPIILFHSLTRSNSALPPTSSRSPKVTSDPSSTSVRTRNSCSRSSRRVPRLERLLHLAGSFQPVQFRYQYKDG